MKHFSCEMTFIFFQNDQCCVRLQLHMGKQSSKIKDILFVTGADFDPPEFKVQKKTIPIKQPTFEYKGFDPQKYYKIDAKDEQILQHEKKLKKKEDILKLFKYYKDFDRINYKEMGLHAASFEVVVEEKLKLLLALSVCAARGIQSNLMNEYCTFSGFLKLILPIAFVMTPFVIHNFLTSKEYHIVNHEYFRTTNNQIALFQQFSYQFNFYKHVEDIKYNFKYPEVRQFYKTKRTVLDQNEASMKGLYREYFEYYNQLKFDKYEEFIKQRQAQRKGKWELLAPEERQAVEVDLQK